MFYKLICFVAKFFGYVPVAPWPLEPQVPVPSDLPDLSRPIVQDDGGDYYSEEELAALNAMYLPIDQRV